MSREVRNEATAIFEGNRRDIIIDMKMTPVELLVDGKLAYGTGLRSRDWDCYNDMHGWQGRGWWARKGI
ncbi:hypothetical protein Tdes44962_MAKER00039 [Teratosphaeria destructans]|uniref:Uncharacterized protein n=1 Tax=Teratosphaeria destructans TaxID=418781 RepID=A0A9W7T3G0_9PEZI|nr:hypothetical protein Tdes44962_MAKER00039 [Teratosphaeria destructans]